MTPTYRQNELRVMLACMGLLASAIAVLTAVLTPGHCLSNGSVLAAHCPACYAALTFFGAAVLPWPRRALRAGVRPALD